MIQTIEERLKGTKVTVRFIRKSNTIGRDELDERSGTIDSVWDTGISINQDYLPFAGSSVGIHTIKDNNGKIIYTNDEVLDAYKGRVPLKRKEMDRVQSKGKFSLI